MRSRLTTGLHAEIVELRLRAWSRFVEYRRDDDARQTLGQQLVACFSAEGSIETCRHGSSLAAAVMISAPRKSSFTGLPQVLCVVDYDLDDPAAHAWCADVLKRMVPQFDARHTIMLDAAYHRLLPGLLQLGTAIDLLLLHGDPTRALARLGLIDEMRLDRAELSVAPLSLAEQVEQILALRASYFAAHPEHAPGDPSRKISAVRQAEIDAFVRDKLSAQVSIDPPTHFVFRRRGGEVLGSFGVTIDRDNPLLGCSAGVEIALAPSIHGLGLGALAYQRLLRLMIERKVDVFKGMTSNPAVIHLARKMGRPLRGWHLCCTAKALPPDHFDYPMDL